MSPKPNPVMYLISDPRVEMSKGKFAAQAAHAAILAYDATPEGWLKHCWRHRGGHYAKVVLQTDNLIWALHYITARGFACELVIDEGRTEFDSDLTPTFLGVQVVDKNNAHVQDTFSAFKLYKDPIDPHVLRERILLKKKHAQVDEMLQKLDAIDNEEKHSFIDKLKERARAYTARRDSGHA